jgi:glycosyltransferase involved in cell wall biosynthesis
MLLNVNQYDVIHIHGLFSFVSLAVALAARLAGRPYIVRPLGSLSTYGVTTRRPLLKRISLALVEGPILKHAAAVHFTSEQELAEAGELGLSFAGIVIPLGVEPAPCREGLIERECRRASEKKTVLFLSRLDRKKNVECVLRAVRLLLDRGLDLTCLIAGDGDPKYVAGLKALGSSLCLDDRVVWLGHVDGEGKAAALAAADVFVLPSWSENFGIAAVEALLAGLPCVLSKGVAIAGDVAAEGACLAVEPEAGEVAEALAALLQNEERRAAMGRRASLVGATRYSVHAMAERLTDLYRKVSRARNA